MSTDHVQAARRAALGLPEATPPLRVPPSLVPAAAAHAQATLRDTARAVEREKLELAARYERNREQEQLRSAAWHTSISSRRFIRGPAATTLRG